MTTIKKIAQIAGVSYSTVSRALNNKPGVRPEIREKIHSIARELDYFPHSSATALVKKRVGVIGVIIPRTSEFAFQNPFYSHMLLGLSTVANANEYHLMLSINGQQNYASLYHRKLVDGIIVVANRIDDDKIPELVEKDIPAVVVPGFPADSTLDIASVNSENHTSVYRAVSYLISLGHRHIAFILGQMNSMYSIERLNAYRAAFHDSGLPFDENYIVESDFSKTDGFRLMGQLLDLPEPPSSVVCINDSVTPGAIHQITSRGLKIPGDISVVAIGCSDLYELFSPPLTAIKTRVVEIGKTAASILIHRIEKGYYNEKQVVIPSDVIIRESTSAVRGQS